MSYSGSTTKTRSFVFFVYFILLVLDEWVMMCVMVLLLCLMDDVNLVLSVDVSSCRGWCLGFRSFSVVTSFIINLISFSGKFVWLGWMSSLCMFGFFLLLVFLKKFLCMFFMMVNMFKSMVRLFIESSSFSFIIEFFITDCFFCWNEDVFFGKKW